MPVSTPAITVTKNPVSQEVAIGGTANFDIAVINSGEVALTNIQVIDSLCTLSALLGGDTNHNSILDVGETWTFTCTKNNVQSAFTNTVTAQGTVVGGPTVSDTANADVTIAPTSVPTLTEWGIILFVVIAMMGSVFYLRRRKKA